MKVFILEKAKIPWHKKTVSTGKFWELQVARLGDPDRIVSPRPFLPSRILSTSKAFRIKGIHSSPLVVREFALQAWMEVYVENLQGYVWFFARANLGSTCRGLLSRKSGLNSERLWPRARCNPEGIG